MKRELIRCYERPRMAVVELRHDCRLLAGSVADAAGTSGATMDVTLEEEDW